jgi:[FeFe] hydrogenase H-cluster maturation GTPase HydF
MSLLVERDNIGIFGRMNAGKSSIMNLVTQQGTSIVDATPGTTADTKISLHEIHGIGPVRIFDTAGTDERDELGEKKRKKVFSDLKECNLVLLVINPAEEGTGPEEEILSSARELDKQILIIYNLFDEDDRGLITAIESKIGLLRFHKKIALRANDETFRTPLIDFILQNYIPENPNLEVLPFVKRDEFYILIIPMDVETPPGRYLRPQAMVDEYITRNWAYPVSFRLDLSAARGNDSQKDVERRRFDAFLNSIGKRPHCVITDSQAMDIMKDWCPPDVMLTTFSIASIQYMSGGRLQAFADGLTALNGLKEGDSVLIVEACNHSRIGEDIGTVQIPKIFEKKFPGVTVDHCFGREFQEKKDLGKYSLLIHCGGCMISRQKMAARIRDLDSIGLPYTNYGVFLSAMQGSGPLRKVLTPWGIMV